MESRLYTRDTSWQVVHHFSFSAYGLDENIQSQCTSAPYQYKKVSIIHQAQILGNPSDQRGALDITRESENLQPMVNYKINEWNLSPFDHSLKQLEIVYL